MEKLWIGLSYLTIFAMVVFCFDDLFIDYISLIFNLKPKKISADQLTKMHSSPQKRIAIMIANWHEADIIERMIHGNVGGIDYINYDVFLGVYPNDQDTLLAAKRLEAYYHHIHVVINSKDGPTSKGQMLNEITNHILAKEIIDKNIYDIFLLQDSEDIIHPLSLKLINHEMQRVDFLQTPVFSLPTKWFDLTRAIYIDEFTESHTKDMLVRDHLKAGIPSAGVGTAMSHLFVSEIRQYQNGQLLKEDTLTEDYHLGIMAKRLGYASKFVCAYVEKDKFTDYIATREYFPSSIKTSIRQKTRWTLGISFQGYKNLKWSSSLAENYFLWRDRRSFVNSLVLILSYTLTISYLGYYLFYDHWPLILTDDFVLLSLLQLNFYLMAIRLIQRFRLVAKLNSYSLALFIPLRWILANFINTTASIKAFSNYYESAKSGKRLQWAKTTHELPEMFGATVIVKPIVILAEQNISEKFNLENNQPEKVL